jgi:hypothetical protein
VCRHVHSLRRLPTASSINQAGGVDPVGSRACRQRSPTSPHSTPSPTPLHAITAPHPACTHWQGPGGAHPVHKHPRGAGHQGTGQRGAQEGWAQRQRRHHLVEHTEVGCHRFLQQLALLCSVESSLPWAVWNERCCCAVLISLGRPPHADCGGFPTLRRAVLRCAATALP